MNRKHLPLHPLAAALALTLTAPAHAGIAADAGDPHREAIRLDALIVTATPLQQSVEDLARPAEVLAGEALDAHKSNSLGETLSRLTGVQSSAFGPGVGRPVIRGLDGARVQVLANGLPALDASTVSADHANSIEPFLADQIEVLKGPATLLYGSGAIGGAVNVVDGRIPQRVPDTDSGLSGRAELRGNTVSDERTGMLRLDGGGGNFAFNASLLSRETDDFRIPVPAEAGHHFDDGHGHGERLENSAIRTKAASFGASLIGERGFIGASYSFFDTLYGVPGHAHGHDDDHDDHDHDHDHHDEHEEDVRIDLRQKRVDVRGALYQPFAGHESLSFRLARNDYEHVELEDDEIGTVFANKGTEGRIEAVHAELGGWRGAYGLQYGRRDFSAEGEEAFVPPSLSRDLGLFLLEERDFGAFKLELGGRLDRVKIDAEDEPTAKFDTASFSLAGKWRAGEDLHVLFGLDRAERAPTAEELYSDGPHLATRSFEIGDEDLDTEVANRIELGLHWHHGRFDAKASAYHTRFSDFIYLADTGEEEDHLPVRQWTQADARFNGIEAEATVRLAENAQGTWDLRLFGDAVRGRLRDGGGDLPRIPAARLGADLRWELGGWRASLGAVRHARQDRVADFEDASAGYTLVDAHLAYHWDVGNVGWEVFLDGTNLTDREARPHTSLLKDLAPLPGRAIAFGIRALF
ncbi:MAG: TonB-dependent receptor [Rehaibacterium terrae]|uniref:TonB-dependent receptor n=1 Tax=Rehaibacterium terrae TaxID=1341696 RepID=UPI00391D0787